MQHHFKINKVKISPGEFNKLVFGRQIEYYAKFEEFKKSAKVNHLSTKHKNLKKSLKEFLDLYDVSEYYFVDFTKDDYQDDSIKIWYK